MPTNNKWEQWLESKEGRASLEPSILKAGNEQYLHNRIYRAFHAGNIPITGKLETKAEALLKRVAQHKGNYLPERLKWEIVNYLKSEGLI